MEEANVNFFVVVVLAFLFPEEHKRQVFSFLVVVIC